MLTMSIGKILLILVFFSSSSVYAACNSFVCDVTNFSGNDDQKIELAIAAAQQTSHKTVYFPNGHYYLNQTITINQLDPEFKIKGQSVDGVVLNSNPIINHNCFGSVFNIDRLGGFSSLFVTIENLTIDFSNNLSHPIFTNGGCSMAGHGIRVGNGWDNGQLRLNRLKILYPPGYGIGIQNSGMGDKDADNVILTSIIVKHAGMDGLDTKQSPNGGNSGLTIIDMTIDQIGFNDEGSAAGLDISYDNFYGKRITVVTDAKRSNPKGISVNTGIRIRQRAQGAASNGILRDLLIKGSHHGVFFEGKDTTLNKNIVVKNFIIKNFEGTGIYIRGEDHTIKVGCSYGGYGEKARSWYIDPTHSDVNSIYFNAAMHSGPHCPPHTLVGSNF